MTRDRSSRQIRARLGRFGPMLTAAALVVGACGGGGGPTGAASPTSATAPTPPAESAGPDGGIEDQSFAVGEHLWHSGFRVEVVNAEIASTTDTLSKKVTTVLTLSMTLENLGTETGFFGPTVSLVTSDNSYAADRFANGIPEVPGGLKSKGTIAFVIDQDFDLGSAMVLIGDAGENQAQIHLGGSGGTVTLEPRELPLSGTLSMELVDLTFRSAMLRYDILSGHREVEKGKLALTLEFDVLSRKSGSWNIFATNLALIPPDGLVIVPDDVVIGPLTGTADGVLTAGRSMRFLVDEMPAGDYTLRLAPGSWFIGTDGVTEATLEFTIP